MSGGLLIEQRAWEWKHMGLGMCVMLSMLGILTSLSVKILKSRAQETGFDEG